jgi:hypothetical protein
MAVLPDVIANTIGGLVTRGIAGGNAASTSALEPSQNGDVPAVIADAANTQLQVTPPKIEDLLASLPAVDLSGGSAQTAVNSDGSSGSGAVLVGLDTTTSWNGALATNAPAVLGAPNPTLLSTLTLQQRIDRLYAALPAATDGIDAASSSGNINSSQKSIMSGYSNLLNYGNVDISFGGSLDNGQAAGQSYVLQGRGFINIDASQNEYFNNYGDVNLINLEATLVHESAHISNYLAWGHGVRTQGQLRQTERNAFSAQADFYQAVEVAPPTYEGLTSAGKFILPLTTLNVNAIAEFDVKGEYPRIYQNLLSTRNSIILHDVQVQSVNAVNVKNGYAPYPLQPIPPRPTPYALPRDLGGK